jgi:2-polyprenyl-3-methyl-5-hydroxy-6-metoxy-1,4-benzoquinol methylase
MKLPPAEYVTSPTIRSLRRWDLREYFSSDPKDFWTIHYRNRLESILSAVTEFVPSDGTILDVGCAQGTAAILLAERGYRVVAVDADPECIRYARQRYEFGDCMLVCLDALKGDGILTLGGEFDAVILGEVLEHVPRPGELLAMCRAKLRDGGVLIITTPNGESPHNWRFRRYDPTTMEASACEDIPSGLGGRETHLFNFRMCTLLALLQGSGFGVRQWEYVNSYAINPSGLHRLLPPSTATALNRICARLPAIARFTTMTLFVVAEKSVQG